MGKLQINHKSYDLPDELIAALQLRRHHDQRAKRSVISIRFAARELEQLRQAHRQSNTWYPLSTWLHNLILWGYPLLLEQEQEGARPSNLPIKEEGRATPAHPTYYQHTHHRRRG